MAHMKNRVGEWSGDLEVVAYAGKPDGKHIEWFVVCRRTVEDPAAEEGRRKCGERERVRVTALGGVRVCCRLCGDRERAARMRASHPRRLYEWTPAMDDAIRRTHRERAGKMISSVPSYGQLAKRWNRPKHAVIARARELGLAAEKKQPEWSEDEMRILERYSWQTPRALWKTLRRAGFKRTLTAVTLKRQRLHLVAGRIWMTRNDLMRGLGIDNWRTVERWVSAGLLYGHWREHEQSESGQGRNGQWIFHRRGVRRFILMHPLEIDLRKVDQTWFFDVITEGNFGENFRDLEEERTMKRGRKGGLVVQADEDEESDFDEGASRSPGELPAVLDWRKAEAAF